MLVKGDKLIVTKTVADFLKEGDIVEILGIDGNVISFSFGGGMHKGVMNFAECEAHFKKYEEPKESPTVTKEMIERIINNSEIEVQTIHDKCTIVSCKLPNGFIIVESSACVSPENYDKDMGVEICMDRIIDKVWELEGYKLQSELYEKETKCPCDCDCGDCPCEDECEDECDECLDADLDCDNCEYYNECWK